MWGPCNGRSAAPLGRGRRSPRTVPAKGRPRMPSFPDPPPTRDALGTEPASDDRRERDLVVVDARTGEELAYLPARWPGATSSV